MPLNIPYNVINPEAPKLLDNEQINVYVPNAGYAIPGISAFLEDHFTIDQNAKVQIKKSLIDDIAKIGKTNPIVRADIAFGESGLVGLANATSRRLDAFETETGENFVEVYRHISDEDAKIYRTIQNDSAEIYQKIQFEREATDNQINAVNNYVNQRESSIRTDLRHYVDDQNSSQTLSLQTFASDRATAAKNAAVNLLNTKVYPVISDHTVKLDYLTKFVEGEANNYTVLSWDEFKVGLTNPNTPILKLRDANSDEYIPFKDLKTGDYIYVLNASAPNFMYASADRVDDRVTIDSYDEVDLVVKDGDAIIGYFFKRVSANKLNNLFDGHGANTVGTVQGVGDYSQKGKSDYCFIFGSGNDGTGASKVGGLNNFAMGERINTDQTSKSIFGFGTKILMGGSYNAGFGNDIRSGGTYNFYIGSNVKDEGSTAQYNLAIGSSVYVSQSAKYNLVTGHSVNANAKGSVIVGGGFSTFSLNVAGSGITYAQSVLAVGNGTVKSDFSLLITNQGNIDAKNSIVSSSVAKVVSTFSFINADQGSVLSDKSLVIGRFGRQANSVYGTPESYCQFTKSIAIGSKTDYKEDLIVENSLLIWDNIPSIKNTVSNSFVMADGTNVGSNAFIFGGNDRLPTVGKTADGLFNCGSETGVGVGFGRQTLVRGNGFAFGYNNNITNVGNVVGAVDVVFGMGNYANGVNIYICGANNTPAYPTDIYGNTRSGNTFIAGGGNKYNKYDYIFGNANTSKDVSRSECSYVFGSNWTIERDNQFLFGNLGDYEPLLSSPKGFYFVTNDGSFNVEVNDSCSFRSKFMEFYPMNDDFVVENDVPALVIGDKIEINTELWVERLVTFSGEIVAYFGNQVSFEKPLYANSIYIHSENQNSPSFYADSTRIEMNAPLTNLNVENHHLNCENGDSYIYTNYLSLYDGGSGSTGYEYFHADNTGIAIYTSLNVPNNDISAMSLNLNGDLNSTGNASISGLLNTNTLKATGSIETTSNIKARTAEVEGESKADIVKATTRCETKVLKLGDTTLNEDGLKRLQSLKAPERGGGDYEQTGDLSSKAPADQEYPVGTLLILDLYYDDKADSLEDKLQADVRLNGLIVINNTTRLYYDRDATMGDPGRYYYDVRYYIDDSDKKGRLSISSDDPRWLFGSDFHGPETTSGKRTMRISAVVI